MSSARQQGFALVIALVLLTVLTLVAVLATRGAGLELQMAANNVSRIEALDSSEATRRGLGEIIDVHTFARGWPVQIGGTVSDSEFDFALPPGLAICAENSPPNQCRFDGAPRNWYLGNTERNEQGLDPGFDPRALDIDAEHRLEVSTAPPTVLLAQIAIYKLATDLNPGAGTAMVAGYEGIGKSAAGGGGRVFYYLSSTAKRAADASAEAETGASFRHVVRN